MGAQQEILIVTLDQPWKTRALLIFWFVVFLLCNIGIPFCLFDDTFMLLRLPDVQGSLAAFLGGSFLIRLIEREANRNDHFRYDQALSILVTLFGIVLINLAVGNSLGELFPKMPLELLDGRAIHLVALAVTVLVALRIAVLDARTSGKTDERLNVSRRTNALKSGFAIVIAACLFAWYLGAAFHQYGERSQAQQMFIFLAVAAAAILAGDAARYFKMLKLPYVLHNGKSLHFDIGIPHYPRLSSDRKPKAISLHHKSRGDIPTNWVASGPYSSVFDQEKSSWSSRTTISQGLRPFKGMREQLLSVYLRDLGSGPLDKEIPTTKVTSDGSLLLGVGSSLEHPEPSGAVFQLPGRYGWRVEGRSRIRAFFLGLASWLERGRDHRLLVELTFTGERALNLYDGLIAWTLEPSQGSHPRRKAVERDLKEAESLARIALDFPYDQLARLKRVIALLSVHQEALGLSIGAQSASFEGGFPMDETNVFASHYEEGALRHE